MTTATAAENVENLENDIKLTRSETRNILNTKKYAYYRQKWLICCSICVFIVILNALINNVSAQASYAETTTSAGTGGDGGSVSIGAGGANNVTAATKRKPKIPYRKGHASYGSLGHENMGAPHFRDVHFSEFVAHANYSVEPDKSNFGMDGVFSVTQYLIDEFFTNGSSFPEGYIMFESHNRIKLGPKVEANDWTDLLAAYWVVLLFVLILLVCIIAMPFIAVCYCCFCCHRRCGRSGPPCDQKPDARKRCCYGFLLLLLTIGLLFGVIIAFVTNKLLERGLHDVAGTLKRGSNDACTFLSVTGSHIEHLYQNNYQELETHIGSELSNAAAHIFSDLGEVAQADALSVLARIIRGMPRALSCMQKVEAIEKEARFYASQLRDALRGVKRDLTYIYGNLCTENSDCEKFINEYDVEFMDLGCLHYDKLPNTTVFVTAMEEIVNENYEYIIAQAEKNLKDLSDKIKQAVDKVVPPIRNDVRNGYTLMKEQAQTIRTLIDSVISNIHVNELRISNSFQEIYVKLGPYRNLTNIILSIILLVILKCLIVALCCGCCGKRPRGYRDDCCNKGAGANCLLIAMFLIFLTFSVICLVGLFYFIFSLIAYEGACEAQKTGHNIPVLLKMNDNIDLNKFIPPELMDSENDEPLPILKMSKAIEACHANQSIYDVLQINRLYSVQNIRLLKILKSLNDVVDQGSVELPESEYSDLVIIPEDNLRKLNEMRKGNLSTYHSNLYTDYICKKFSPVDLRTLANAIDNLASTIHWDSYKQAVLALRNEAIHLRAYQEKLYDPLKDKVDEIHRLLDEIDKLILLENNIFDDSVYLLLNEILYAQDFIRKRGKSFVDDVYRNLTNYVLNQVERYRENVLEKSAKDVGRCAKIAYIYDNSLNLLCQHMVNPMNGFWFAILLSCLLFLPILWISHKLQCLYRKTDPYAVPPEGGDYLYDAYSERDHIPMASGPKKRRKGYDRRRDYEYYDDASPGMSSHAMGSSGMRDSRYKDMAPQHWDSEPPRYHNPPMAPPASEYERPPPYYYPGAAEQD